MNLEKLTELIVELELDLIQDAVREALEQNKNEPLEILNALTRGMDKVGSLYEEKEYYLTELVLAGEAMKEALKILQPALLSRGNTGEKTKVVIATVKGDNHDIGKNILSSLLLSSGFEIHDLGMDVSAEKIAMTVKETGAKIVALSTLLTSTVEQVKVVHDTLKKENLRDDVKLIVGGAALTKDIAKKLGADDFASDAVEGVKNIKKLARM
ncbi:MAG: cobalamin-dependent protein [Promethearchaeota archaeon]